MKVYQNLRNSYINSLLYRTCLKRNLKGPEHFSAKARFPFNQGTLTYLLTPWSRVLLEKLTGSAASQEIPSIFGTRRFLTVPTSACPYLEPTPSSPHNCLPLPEDP